MPEYINEEDEVVTYALQIGKVQFFDNYLIIEVAEGACFNHQQAEKLSVLTNHHFGSKPFGYISNRVNSYSLDPLDYMRIWEVFPNLKTFAVVVYNKIQKNSVQIEKMFFNGEMVIFDKLEDAVDWTTKELRG